jgi:CelD/BcsL family acetyltransferase involved in cellulose biosynthesis/peptidoglycan/xylan/chitin deacetylase (PgdA/CDA1 family)
MLRVTKYSNWNELQELAPQWNDLLSRSAADTVFLTWQWCETWWKNYHDGHEIFVVAAFEGKEIAGIAPLFCEEVRQYGKTWRRLRLIGDGSHDSDYLDFFAKRGREKEVMRAFARFLGTQRESWDWIELNGPKQESPCSSDFVRCANQDGWQLTSELIPCATLSLPRNWYDYLRQLSPRFKTTVRSTLALLNDSLSATPRACSSQSDVAEWLPVLFDLHTRRWAADDLPGVFRDSAKRAFYQDLSRAAFEQGWLSFHRLDWAERPLAVQYGLTYNNRFHLLQEGYDPSFASVRPGVALRGWLIRHWIEQGLQEYDFLAGASAYKMAWGAQEKFCARILIAPNRSGALVALDLPKWRMQAREKLAAMTPAPVLSLRKRTLERSAKSMSYQSSSVESTEMASAIGDKTRRLFCKVYSSTPLGLMGRTIATRYNWNRPSLWTLPVRRPTPVLHILQYHRVNDGRDPFLGGLAVESFRAQMQYVARNFPLLSLDQVAAKNISPQHGCYVAVTFDDGYRDNFLCAFPILKQFNIPATVFLATSYIGLELPWYDKVRLAFKLTTRQHFSVIGSNGPAGSLQDVPRRLQSMERALTWLRSLPDQERQPALNALFETLGVPPSITLPNQMLQWDDIRQMTKQKVSFGAHTMTHPVLSKIPASQMKEEIEGSRQAIENRLQLPVSHFAYPFGQSQDFNGEAKQAVQAAGFKTAVTTIWGLNQPDEDPFELKRFTPWETDPAEFKLRLDWFRFREPQSLTDYRTLDRPASVGHEVRV